MRHGWLTNATTAKSEVRYGYDGLGRLQTVKLVKREGATLPTPEVTTYAYTKLGSVQDVYYPSGVHAVYQYDALNRLTNLTQTNATVLLAQYSYVSNANGWRQSATEVVRQTNGSCATQQWTWGCSNTTCGRGVAIRRWGGSAWRTRWKACERTRGVSRSMRIARTTR